MLAESAPTQHSTKQTTQEPWGMQKGTDCTQKVRAQFAGEECVGSEKNWRRAPMSTFCTMLSSDMMNENTT